MASGSYLLGRDRPRCLRSQTGNVAVIRSTSGCYMTMIKEERLDLLRVPLATRMKSPGWAMQCLALSCTNKCSYGE